MADRQDIDALLIGSLYGELSSADEARLQAHLESVPADRTALDRLTHARDAVRRSRILEVQLEPPQSVSAMLLQEAARRAPRKAEAGEGWFVRLRRSFLMHPAMAAAAMLVVVLGVASTLYLREGDHFAAPRVSAVDRSEQVASGSSAAAPSAAATPQPPALADPGEPAPGAAGDATAKQANADSAYRVGLVEGSTRRAKEAQSEAKADAIKAEQARAAEAIAAMPKQAGPGALLEVTTPDHRPKDLDDAADGRVSQADLKAPAPARPAPAVRGFAPSADPRSTASRGDSPSAPRAPEAAPPPPPVAANEIATNEETAKLRQAQPGGSSGGGSFASAPMGGGEDKGGAREADAAWSKDQHARLLTQVRAGQCRDAASTALALSSRAPGYYQQNVETDRAVKTCLPLINAVREQEAERAQRVRATTRRAPEAPAKAEPARAKPAATAPRK